MRGSLPCCALMALLLCAFAVLPAHAAQVVSSSSGNVSAVMQAGGFHIRPAGSAGQFGGDLAPIQTFEIVRPDNQRLTIGRLFTSCSCVRLESPKQTYEPGEPAVLHLRNIYPTPPNGQNYAIYVQVTSPIRTTLRFDTFVRSSQFIPGGIGEAPTRGNIIADGVMASLSSYDGDIELIVPKADASLEDTSDYYLRQSAELDNASGVVQSSAATGDGLADTDPDSGAAAARPGASLSTTAETAGPSPAGTVPDTDATAIWADVQPRRKMADRDAIPSSGDAGAPTAHLARADARMNPEDEIDADDDGPVVSQFIDDIEDVDAVFAGVDGLAVLDDGSEGGGESTDAVRE